MVIFHGYVSLPEGNNQTFRGVSRDFSPLALISIGRMQHDFLSIWKKPRSIILSG